jgi:ABC-type molybdate transport system substrate-binding protein
MQYPKVNTFLASSFCTVLTICLSVVEGGTVERRITAFCGSASKPAIEEAAAQFEQETGIRIDLHFSGSGTMLSHRSRGLCHLENEAFHGSLMKLLKCC